MAKRPERPCLTCGTPTTAQSGICRRRSCRPPKWEEPAYEDTLKGGDWVPRNGIARWVPREVA